MGMGGLILGGKMGLDALGLGNKTPHGNGIRFLPF